MHNTGCQIHSMVSCDRGNAGVHGKLSLVPRAQSRRKNLKGVVTLMRHEKLTITINRFSLRASTNLHSLFAKSSSWELYHNELSDLDVVHRNSKDIFEETQVATLACRSSRMCLPFP